MIENTYIEKLHHNDIKNKGSFKLSKCFIKTIDFMTGNINIPIIVENCFIENFEILSCWFDQGLALKNCHIKNYIDYQMGGHNHKPILIDGNVFENFFNFFDCQFIELIEVKNNIFLKGSNLLGNINEGFQNTFEMQPIVKNNIGNLYLDGDGGEIKDVP